MPSRRSRLSLNQMLTISIAIFAILVTSIAAFVSGHDWFTSPKSIQKVESLGRVTDEISQQPISGAQVTLDLEGPPLIVYTDSQGVYLLEVAVGSDTIGQIRVDAKGYEPYTRHVTIYPELGTIQDIRLKQLQMGTAIPATATEVPIVTPIYTLTPTGKIFATISNELYNAGLRRSPGYINKDVSQDIIVEIVGGQTVEILGESQMADGLLWWYVSWNGYKGWIADHTGSGKQILIFQ